MQVVGKLACVRIALDVRRAVGQTGQHQGDELAAALIRLAVDDGEAARAKARRERIHALAQGRRGRLHPIREAD
ncbi:MAG TPA: hypothetical protein VFF43_07420, partial [Caldimonas sp.]|nr:hypothetical protein [Caldimonas sp.]